MLLEMLRHPCHQVVACLAAKDAVVAVRIYLLVELLAGLNERFGVFGKVAEVHVVVSHTVNEQQFATQLGCMCHG